jgi:hypothetical protein
VNIIALVHSKEMLPHVHRLLRPANRSQRSFAQTTMQPRAVGRTSSKQNTN